MPFALILLAGVFGLFTSQSSFARDEFGSPIAEVQVSELLKLEFPFVPDRETLKGSLCTVDDPDFSYLRYDEKIPYCERQVERATKAAIYRAYGVSEKCRGDYTIDHFIPLALSGSNHVDNLWPENKAIKHLRQNLELELFKRMDQGTITQAEAIATIRRQKWNPPISNPEGFRFCR